MTVTSRDHVPGAPRPAPRPRARRARPAAGRAGWRATLAIGLPLLVLAAACGSSGEASESSSTEPTTPQPQEGGTVVVGLGDDLTGFNPAVDRVSYSTQSVYKALYDPIAVIDEEGVAQPYLVESIEPNEDFTEWYITMRDGIEFHNGDPLTPQILATHLKTMQEAPLTFFTFKPIEAVGVVDEAARLQLEAGEITEEEYDLRRRQVYITMAEPWSTFPAFLAAYQVGFVAHPDFVAGEMDEPVGTGPFVLDEWERGNHISFTRNPDYWRAGLPYLDAVEFRTLTDPQSRYDAVQAGDVDLIVTNAPSQVAELVTTGVADELVLTRDTGAGDEMVVILNTQTGPTSDLRVRRALQLATDRALINEALYDGYFQLASAPYAESSDWYTDPGWPEPDLDEATRLVEEWEAENGPLTIELQAFNTNDDLELAQTLQEQWAKVGVDTTITSGSEADAAQVVPNGEYQAYQVQFMNGADPDEHYPFWEPDPEDIGGPGEFSINFSRYTSPVVQESLNGARRTADRAERQALYAEVWRDWAENVPYLWIFHAEQLMVSHERVKGLETVTTPEGTAARGFVSGSIFLTEVWNDA